MPVWLGVVLCFIGAIGFVGGIALTAGGEGFGGLLMMLVFGAIGYFGGVKQIHATEHSQHITSQRLLEATFPRMRAVHVWGVEVFNYHVASRPNYVCEAEFTIKHGRPIVTITEGGSYCEEPLT